jgi:hypothetical protein
MRRLPATTGAILIAYEFKARIIHVIESIKSINICSSMLLTGRTTRSFSAAELSLPGKQPASLRRHGSVMR